MYILYIYIFGMFFHVYILITLMFFNIYFQYFKMCHIYTTTVQRNVSIKVFCLPTDAQ
jgi:hypothetical protein